MGTAGPAGGNGQAPTQQQPAAPGSGNGQVPATPLVNNASAPSGGQSGQAPAANTDPTSQPSADEWQRIRQELDEARRDAAKYRSELKAREDAQLTAEQKRERDFGELQTKSLELELTLQRLQMENAGLRLAPTLGIADPGAALALVQAEHAHELKFSADGRPENLDTLLKQVLKDHPVLAAQPSRPATPPAASGGPTNPGRQAGNGGLTLEMIKAMPMRERIARMEEIKAWEKAQQQTK
jgi:hypothetical protein